MYKQSTLLNKAVVSKTISSSTAISLFNKITLPAGTFIASIASLFFIQRKNLEQIVKTQSKKWKNSMITMLKAMINSKEEKLDGNINKGSKRDSNDSKSNHDTTDS